MCLFSLLVFTEESYHNMTSLRFRVSLHYSPWPRLTALRVLGAVRSILILLKTNMRVLLGLGVLSFGLIVIF